MEYTALNTDVWPHLLHFEACLPRPPAGVRCFIVLLGWCIYHEKIMIDGVPVEPRISIATFSPLLFMYLGRCNLHQSNKPWPRGVNSFCRCDLSIKEPRQSLLGLARRLAILIWMWTSSKISTLVPCHRLRPNIHWLPNQLSYTFWNSPIGERSGGYKKLPFQDLRRCTAVVWLSPGNHWH